MSWFPKPVGPRAALSDLLAFMRQRSREQVIGAALAVLVTAIIVIEFLVDSKIDTAPPPQIVYVEALSVEPDRRRDHRRPEEGPGEASDAADKEKQRQFQKLEKQLGM